jgi:hypothetical protein
MLREIVQTRFDRGPRRNPQRIYTGFFVQDLGDMAAFRRNGETDEFVSDVYGAPAMKAYFVCLKRINRLLKILFISLDACQALAI